MIIYFGTRKGCDSLASQNFKLLIGMPTAWDAFISFIHIFCDLLQGKLWKYSLVGQYWILFPDPPPRHRKPLEQNGIMSWNLQEQNRILSCVAKATKGNKIIFCSPNKTTTTEQKFNFVTLLRIIWFARDLSPKNGSKHDCRINQSFFYLGFFSQFKSPAWISQKLKKG